MSITIHEMARKLESVTACRIFYHMKPDGDAIGSAHALALALMQRGVAGELIVDGIIPPQYNELVRQVPSQRVDRMDCVHIAVDSTNPARLGRYQHERIDLCIDHHEHNGFATQDKCVDEHSASCAEIVYQIISEMEGVTVRPLMAELLYSGLITDAACFRSASTTPDTLVHAAEIARHGVRMTELARRYFVKKSASRMQIEKILLNSVRFSFGGRVAGATLTAADYMTTDIGDEGTEGLNELMDQYDGVDMAIIIREKVPNECRVSVRAAAPYSAVPVCSANGGGGHPHAAGCVLQGNPLEVLAHMEKACANYLTAEDA